MHKLQKTKLIQIIIKKWISCPANILSTTIPNHLDSKEPDPIPPSHSAPFARRMEDPNPNTILILFARHRMKTVELLVPFYKTLNAIIAVIKDIFLPIAQTRSVFFEINMDTLCQDAPRIPKKWLTDFWTNAIKITKEGEKMFFKDRFRLLQLQLHLHPPFRQCLKMHLLCQRSQSKQMRLPQWWVIQPLPKLQHHWQFPRKR